MQDIHNNKKYKHLLYLPSFNLFDTTFDKNKQNAGNRHSFPNI